MATAAAPQPRLASLDQFRGYTVAGMFLVNYLGGFIVCPFVLKHHNTYCSYADTIMAGFFFAVGFSMRLSFGRREMQQGLATAYWHMAKRLFGLALVAIFISHQGHPELDKAPFTWETMKHLGVWNALRDPAKHSWFQTLMHIAVTSLWILPVLRLKPIWRISYMIASAAIHLTLSYYFNFYWVNGTPPPSGIDGGPLGFLTWTIPTMIGTLACDVVMEPRSRAAMLARLFIGGAFLMAIGWILSCGTRMYDVPADQVAALSKEKLAAHPVIPTRAQFDGWWTNVKQRHWSKVLAEPPFVPPPHSQEPSEKVTPDGVRKSVDKSDLDRKWNYWMMSQRVGTISYLTFGAGFSLALYGLFYVLADMIGLKIGVFRTLGTNALLGYVLHDFTGDAVKKFIPDDVPPTVMWISFAVFFYITWLFIRSLEKRKIYIKL